jgi:hypothetical protein
MQLRESIAGMLLAVALLQGAPPEVVSQSARPTVAELSATLNDARDRVIVRFRVADGLTEDALERIESGIAVSLKYRLRLTAKRGFLMLPRKEVARTRIRVVASYDSLTGQYSLTRTIEVRTKRKRDRPPLIETTHTTASLDEMRAWMTEFEEIPLYEPDRAIEEETLRVKLDSDLGRRYVMLIFPSTIDASGEFDLEK